jgi:hypothetical protein
VRSRVKSQPQPNHLHNTPSRPLRAYRCHGGTSYDPPAPSSRRSFNDAVGEVPLGLCHPAQSGQAPQALAASHLLGRWFRPPGGGAGFCRAQRDATKRCDGVKGRMVASDRRLTCRLAEGNEEPPGALNDAGHGRAGSMLTESASIGMTAITTLLAADGCNFRGFPDFRGLS